MPLGLVTFSLNLEGDLSLLLARRPAPTIVCKTIFFDICSDRPNSLPISITVSAKLKI